MIVFSIEKPVTQTACLAIAHSLEQVQRGFVLHGNNGIQLVQMKGVVDILMQALYSCLCITLTAIGLTDNDAYLCFLVRGVELHEIGQSDGLVPVILNYQADLFVGIDIASGI